MDLEMAKERYPNLVTFTGFDNAFVGGVTIAGQEPIACYHYSKMLSNLTPDIPLEDAREYLTFNVMGAYFGESTPAVLEDE